MIVQQYTHSVLVYKVDSHDWIMGVHVYTHCISARVTSYKGNPLQPLYQVTPFYKVVVQGLVAQWLERPV